MAQKKNSFILSGDDWEIIKELSIIDKGYLLTALFEYQITGVEIVLSQTTQIIFKILKKRMDYANARYKEICKKRKMVGVLGGAPKGNTNASKKQAKQANGYFYSDNVNEINELKKKQAKQANGYFYSDNVNEINELKKKQAKKINICFCNNNINKNKKNNNKYINPSIRAQDLPVDKSDNFFIKDNNTNEINELHLPILAPPVITSEQVLIDKDYFIDFTDSAFAIYAPLGTRTKNNLNIWLRQKFLNRAIDKSFICRQLIAFARKNGDLDSLLGRG